jgi:hypothetical protein
VTRPDRPGPDHEWKVDTHARLAREGKKCRAGAQPGKPACGQPAVAEINCMRLIRGLLRDDWRAYCGAHLHKRGRQIIGGQIWGWVRDEPAWHGRR